MTHKYSLMFIAALSLAMTACSTTQSSDQYGATGATQGGGMVRQVSFASNESDIPGSEQHKIAEIATFMANNPSRTVSMDNRAETDPGFPRTVNLSDLRQESIRAALVQAGVADTRIRMPQHGQRDGAHHGEQLVK